MSQIRGAAPGVLTLAPTVSSDVAAPDAPEFSITLRHVSVTLPDGRALLHDLNETFQCERVGLLGRCRIPDDCIDSKRYPLFMARAVLKELIESLQSTQGVKPC